MEIFKAFVHGFSFFPCLVSGTMSPAEGVDTDRLVACVGKGRLVVCVCKGRLVVRVGVCNDSDEVPGLDVVVTKGTVGCGVVSNEVIILAVVPLSKDNVVLVGNVVIADTVEVVVGVVLLKSMLLLVAFADPTIVLNGDASFWCAVVVTCRARTWYPSFLRCV